MNPKNILNQCNYEEAIHWYQILLIETRSPDTMHQKYQGKNVFVQFAPESL